MSWAYDNLDKHLIHLRIDFHPFTVRSLPLFRINPVWCVICFVFCWTLLTTVIKFNFLNNKCTTIFIQQKRNLKIAVLPAHIFMSTYFHACTLFFKVSTFNHYKQFIIKTSIWHNFYNLFVNAHFTETKSLMVFQFTINPNVSHLS